MNYSWINIGDLHFADQRHEKKDIFFVPLASITSI